MHPFSLPHTLVLVSLSSFLVYGLCLDVCVLSRVYYTNGELKIKFHSSASFRKTIFYVSNAECPELLHYTEPSIYIHYLEGVGVTLRVWSSWFLRCYDAVTRPLALHSALAEGDRRRSGLSSSACSVSSWEPSSWWSIPGRWFV